MTKTIAQLAHEFTLLVERNMRGDLPDGVAPASDSEVTEAMYALRGAIANSLSGNDEVNAKRYRFWRDCWGSEQFLPTLSRTITSLSTPLKKGDYNNFDIVSDAAMDNGMCKS